MCPVPDQGSVPTIRLSQDSAHACFSTSIFRCGREMLYAERLWRRQKTQKSLRVSSGYRGLDALRRRLKSQPMLAKLVEFDYWSLAEGEDP